MTEENLYRPAFRAWKKDRSAVADYRERSPFANANGRWPDFLIAGAVKGGTTWLAENLIWHPEIWLSSIKEVNYFNTVFFEGLDWNEICRPHIDTALAELQGVAPDDLTQWSRLKALEELAERTTIDEASYTAFFAHAGVDMLCGEASPEYSMLPRHAISHIRAKNPSTKVIFLLRDPIDRVWSNMRMLGLADVESTDDIPEPLWLALYGRSNYPAMLRRWRGAFPPDQVLVISNDEVAASGPAVMRRVCDFLSISFNEQFFERSVERIFESERAEMHANLYEGLREKMAPIYEGLTASVGDMATDWQRKHYS